MAGEDQWADAAGGAPVAGTPRLDTVLAGFDTVTPQFFETSPDAVMIVARDGRLLFANTIARRTFELDDAVEIGKLHWHDLWPEKYRHDVEEAFRLARSGGNSRFTARRPSSRGATRSWDVAVSGIMDAAGAWVGILVISRDVTASHALAETLRRSQQQFQALANNMAQLAWMADPDGLIFWYNQRWFNYTGAKMEAIAGDGWRSLHHPDHVGRVVDKYNRCIASGSVWEDLFPLRGVDGNYHWFLSRAMPVRGQDGRIEFWCGTNTDVTEHRRQNQRLRKLARIIEMSHEAMLVREIGGSIILWNRGCEDLYGFDKSQAVGTSIFELLKPKNIAPGAEFDNHIVANGAWSGEVLYTAEDGTDAWVDSRQELINVGDRRLILETSRDITERREADEIRNLLVGELNHRVKNTLAIVQSIAAQTVRSSPSPAKFVSSFNGRLQSLASAHNILSDVAWAGAPINELIASQIAALDTDPNRIRLEGEPIQLPPQTALQLALIFHELAANALEHGALSTEEGRLTVSWVATAGDPRQIEVTWREEGGPAVVTPASRGFGLTLIERSSALPNIKTAVEFHPDGVVARVVAEARGDSHPAGLFNPGQKRVPGRRPERRPERNIVRRVLIMDRSLSRALLLEDLLDNAGYVAAGPVSSLAAATAELDQHRVDLVAVDVDEIEAADIAVLIEDLGRRGVPCLALGTASRLAGIPEGTFASLVAKPIEEPMFSAAVGAALRGNGAARRGEWS